ncbi:hypothetical protein RRG08_019629 [Elysia crispata]|uniref:Uncharacterized protein n=1 Tax=Elysia crispata TaxID=231223 RepID=A0AAE1DL84_9GAST|nr:hypothetical protein RRG08_019629 [Elysia crispata]
MTSSMPRSRPLSARELGQTLLLSYQTAVGNAARLTAGVDIVYLYLSLPDTAKYDCRQTSHTGRDYKNRLKLVQPSAPLCTFSTKYETEKVLWQEDAKSDFNLSPMTIEGVRRGGCRRGMFWRLGECPLSREDRLCRQQSGAICLTGNAPRGTHITKHAEHANCIRYTHT